MKLMNAILAKAIGGGSAAGGSAPFAIFDSALDLGKMEDLTNETPFAIPPEFVEELKAEPDIFIAKATILDGKGAFCQISAIFTRGQLAGMTVWNAVLLFVAGAKLYSVTIGRLEADGEIGYVGQLGIIE